LAAELRPELSLTPKVAWTQSRCMACRMEFGEVFLHGFETAKVPFHEERQLSRCKAPDSIFSFSEYRATGAESAPLRC